jgi:hypothetical protein
MIMIVITISSSMIVKPRARLVLREYLAGGRA